MTFEDQPAGPSNFSAAGPTQTLTYTFGTLTATFTGGVILTNESNQTTDNSNVYATGAVSVVAGDPSLTNPLLVTFNQPVHNFEIQILNALSGNYQLSDNAGNSLNFNLATTGGSIQTEGFAATGTQVQINYLDGPWDFAIDNVTFDQPLTGSTPEPASLVSLGTGLLFLGLGAIRRRRQAR
ncbi:MAG: PEP-CTERM sorting domain-containing protein [Bryobacteraceae bacterium]